jgi:hypothetical protein
MENGCLWYRGVLRHDVRFLPKPWSLCPKRRFNSPLETHAAVHGTLKLEDTGVIGSPSFQALKSPAVRLLGNPSATTPINPSEQGPDLKENWC